MKQIGSIFGGIAVLFISSILIYFSIWEMLVGGIAGLIDQVKAPHTDSGVVAWSIVKILLFEIPLALALWMLILVGFLFSSQKSNKRYY